MIQCASFGGHPCHPGISLSYLIKIAHCVQIYCGAIKVKAIHQAHHSYHYYCNFHVKRDYYTLSVCHNNDQLCHIQYPAIDVSVVRNLSATF